MPCRRCGCRSRRCLVAKPSRCYCQGRTWHFRCERIILIYAAATRAANIKFRDASGRPNHPSRLRGPVRSRGSAGDLLHWITPPNLSSKAARQRPRRPRRKRAARWPTSRRHGKRRHVESPLAWASRLKFAQGSLVKSSSFTVRSWLYRWGVRHPGAPTRPAPRTSACATLALNAAE